MIRFLLRFIGLCLLATAFVFFVYDGTKSIANQHLVYIEVERGLGDGRSEQPQPGAELAEAKSAVGLGPLRAAAFDLPTWAVLAIVAMILILLGRKKSR